jgi:hypothetical protein
MFRFDIETKHKMMAGFRFDIESERNFELKIEKLCSFRHKMYKKLHL